MTKKILLTAVVLILVTTIVLTVLIKIYITPESVRAFLIPEAEKILDRKVDLGEIDISLFKGIHVKDFAVKEKDRTTDFVKCRDFILKYRLLPLLAGKVVIEELKLASPMVIIERNLQGEFNFQDIGQKQKTQQEVKEAGKTAETKGIPISLLIDSIIIENASFSFLDHKKELPEIKGAADVDMSIRSVEESGLFSRGSMDLKLDEIVIKKPYEKRIRNIDSKLRYAIHINIKSKKLLIDRTELEIQGIAAAISGSLANINTSPVMDITVSIPETDISDIQKTLASFTDMEDLVLSGRIKADLNLKGLPGKIESLETDGVVTLKKVGVSYNNNNVDTVFDGSLKFDKQSMGFNLKGTVGKNTAELKGSVESYLKNQKINLNIYSEQLFLDALIQRGKIKAQQLLQKALRPQKSLLESQNRLTLSLQLKGKSK